MNIYSIYLCYQPIKNMKYMGPKGSVSVTYKNQNKPLIEHTMSSTSASINGSCYHHVVVGFEGDKVLKCINYKDNIGYSTVPEYKITNHGRVIADIIKKYNFQKYNGILINTDISCLLTKPLDIDTTKNYVMYFDKNHTESDITCNIIDGLVEHISFNSSQDYWSGICYLNNNTIKLLKFINKIKFTDPMFMWEIINYVKDHGIVFDSLNLTSKQYKYISNDMLKATKVVRNK